jgi:hypothetical protein
MKRFMFLSVGLLALAGCSSAGAVGEDCTVDADCEDGLVCHVEAHDEEEEEGEDHDEGGMCEEAGAHDDDHTDEDHTDE